MKRRNTFRAALALLLILTLCMPAAASGFTEKLIAITFDDGPGAYTAQLLDELAARDVKATFFVSGYRAANYPETLKRMVSEGHQLASHTQNHENLNTLSAAKIADEISRTQDYITAAGGDNPAYIRPPYGNANKTVRAQAPSPLINWSVDPEDWKYRDSETVRQNIEAGVFDGAIILVHDIYRTSVDGALAAIDDLLAEGYEFVTVQELLLRRGITPEAATVYYSAKNNGVNLPADAVGPQAFDESQLQSHWGYEAMKRCLDYGWMTLTDTGEWKPNAYVTRAEFAADLARFAGIHVFYPTDGAAQFSDVDPASDLAPYIAWASDSGIVTGFDDGTFRPGRTLTREQMAAMLARFYALSGITAAGSADGYADADAISAWAVNGVALCTARGLVQGDPQGRFRPQSDLTRAQIAAILSRMAK